MGSVTDITERKLTEEVLRESEEKFRSLAEVSPNMVFIHQNGRIVYANHIFTEIMGYDFNELYSHDFNFLSLVSSESVGKATENFKKQMNDEEVPQCKYTLITKEGKNIEVTISTKLIDCDGEKAILGIVTDITDRIKAVESLRTSEENYKGLTREFNALLDGISDNLILLSPDLKIQWANKAFAGKIRQKPSDLCGIHCYQLCCNIVKPCRNCPVLVSFKTGKEETMRVMSSEGRIYDKRAFPIIDLNGKVINVIEIARDITANVHMEEEAKLVQSRLIHANKMTSLGTLVSGVAHEINNPNSFVMNNAQVMSEIWSGVVKILSREYRSNKDLAFAGLPFPEIKKVVPKMLYGITDGSLRIKHIVDNLRDFSRPEKSRLDGKIDINKVIMTSVSMLDNQIKNHTNTFRTICAENLPVVKGSALQIEQVVINLIMNALQALPDRKSGIKIFTLKNIKTHTVDIKVKDEGAGISRDIIDRVMEPFFTTRLEVGGTGIGLSISHAIIDEHRGSLKIRSKKGKGTTVTVKLPWHIENE